VHFSATSWQKLQITRILILSVLSFILAILWNLFEEVWNKSIDLSRLVWEYHNAKILKSLSCIITLNLRSTAYVYVYPLWLAVWKVKCVKLPYEESASSCFLNMKIWYMLYIYHIGSLVRNIYLFSKFWTRCFALNMRETCVLLWSI
jgi:hypothetical protein